jgi:C4-dicarboxylate-specific signal transduction histidine kinase
LENARLYADLVVENAERQKAEEERRQAEEALQRMQTELAAASRLATIGELAGSIVHEINQPLGAILQNAFAAVSWLSRESPELVEARGAIADIEQDVQRVAEVIKGLKNLARKSGLQLTTLDMGRAIREVLALMHGELRRGNIVVQLDPAGLDRSVVGDRVQLHQVLVNLIRNATEAMSGIGGRPRTLKIFAQRVETGRLEIAVADAGTGLRAGTANQIFDPLFTTKPDGMGMGLAICRSIVAAHQGRLWATPNHPYGTIFRFTLPMATGSSAAFVPAQRTVSALSA